MIPTGGAVMHVGEPVGRSIVYAKGLRSTQKYCDVPMVKNAKDTKSTINPVWK